MNADAMVDLWRQTLWTAFLVAAPPVVAAMVVGLVVSVLQAATQIQETTLAFVLKWASAAGVLLALGGWMIARVIQYSGGLLQLISTLRPDGSSGGA